MNKTRELIQSGALNKAKENNYNGVICLDPGSGKTKVAIDCIKQGNFKNILITSPRTNLKENWRSELEKWSIIWKHDISWRDIKNEKYLSITLENIQTTFRWSENLLKQFDFIIIDEIHCIGNEYFALIEKAQKFDINGDIHQKAPVPILGLTGTPTLSDPWKKEVLYKALPIIYEYYDAEEDGITNKIQYWKFEYELTDAYKVVAGTKTKKWYVGEAKQYVYLSEKYEEAKNKMFELGASDYFETSMLWMKGSTKVLDPFDETKTIYFIQHFSPEQKEAGRKFFNAVRYRKEFLWNLESSKQITLELKSKILLANFSQCKITEEYKDLFYTQNKVLLFSELTQQAEKLSPYSIHSNNGKNAKETEAINKELLERFNNGEIRELSSVNSLSLGINLVSTGFAIFESFSGSQTNAIQRVKRLARLKADEVAHCFIIVPSNTQASEWYKSAFGWVDSSKIIKSIDEIII